MFVCFSALEIISVFKNKTRIEVPFLRWTIAFKKPLCLAPRQEEMPKIKLEFRWSRKLLGSSSSGGYCSIWTSPHAGEGRAGLTCWTPGDGRGAGSGTPAFPLVLTSVSLTSVFAALKYPAGEKPCNPLAHRLVLTVGAELTEAGFVWIAGQGAERRRHGQWTSLFTSIGEVRQYCSALGFHNA